MKKLLPPSIICIKLISRLIILLLVVGCDRYEYISDDKRFDKWKGNTHLLKQDCEEIDEDTVPVAVKNLIDKWKEKYPSLTLWTNSMIYHDLKTDDIWKDVARYAYWREVEKPKCKMIWVKQ